MKVSLSWLRDFVDISMDLKDLAHLLTMAGLEVEGTHPVGQGFGKVIVSEIESVRKHPNAERLTLVSVRIGEGTVPVVCGATNIKAGQRVPLALVGAKLPNGAEIKKSKIRGEISEGMLCSETELGLGGDASGIMILSADAPLGKDLGDALGLKDTVLEISVTPNRPDCLCILGVAREIAALTRQKIRYPRLILPDEGQEIHQKTSVTIQDPDLCPRYVARMIEGVTIGPSPAWMKNRLERVGIRSINNVVDVTNYIMVEVGQPLHAFDFRFLEEGRIVVRRAKAGEVFVTLDGVKRLLDAEMLMICDGIKPVAIAGVMGGLNSEIREDTRTVFLESAYFDPTGNRKTALKLGLETEAAYRFGRGVDYGGARSAANRATQLIQELSGGRVVEGAVDAYPAPLQPNRIRLDVRKANQFLGTAIPAAQVKDHLEALELEVQNEGDHVFRVIPPSFRGDLVREVDLVEEIARLDGYDRIPVTLPKGEPAPSSEEKQRESRVEKRVIEILTHYGYDEVLTYSFTSPVSLDGIDLSPGDPRRRQVRIVNPLSEDLAVLRTSLIPGLMETARYNFSWKNSNFKIFELRRVFLPQEGERLPREVRFLAAVAAWLETDLHWAVPPRPVDFYDAKGCIEDLLESLRIPEPRFVRAEDVPYLHPGKAARILAGGTEIGVLGEVHPRVTERYAFPDKARVHLFEVNFELLLKWAGAENQFRPLPKFPAVDRDLSLVVDQSLEAEKIMEAIRDLRYPILEGIQLFDVYRGTPIPEGKKGLSYRIRYQSRDRTLTDEEVNGVHEKVIQRLREVFQAELRR
jgi:phenylalanyl-tRNA synthetase beta chain